MTTARRLIALAAVLALTVGNVVACAGWESSAEARMACCMDSATCPMHKSETHEHASSKVLTQTQADSCCAAATQRHDSASQSTFAASAVTALVPVPLFTHLVPTFAPNDRRIDVPLPPPSIATHLRLSVLLV